MCKTLPRLLPIFAAAARRALAIIAIAAFPVATVSAAPIAKDTLNDYVTGDLAGQGVAGEGWAGAWVAGPLTTVTREVFDSSTSGAMNITPGGGGIPVNGGARTLDLFAPAGLGTATQSGISATRALSEPQTTTFYVGYVLRWVSGNFNTGDAFTLHLTDSPTDSDRGFNFGIRGLPTTHGVIARRGTGSPLAGAFSTFASSTNANVRYLVARIEKDGDDNFNAITVWINPGVNSEAEKPDGDLRLRADTGLEAITSVNLRVEGFRSPDAGTNGNDRVRVDSLMLATAFSDLVGVGTVVGAGNIIGVEAAANGSAGGIFPARSLAAGDSVILYAVERTPGGAFVRNVAANWSLLDTSGEVNDAHLVVAPDRKSAVFNAIRNGSASIRATAGTATTSVASGMLTVAGPTVHSPGQPRPFIWVRESEKPAILEKIATQPWADSAFKALVARAAPAVSQHQANRDAFLRGLPILWTRAIPVFNAIGLTGSESAVRGAAESKFNQALDCAVLYYLTGDEKYARCAADILHNSVQAFVNLHIDRDLLVGGWLFQKEFLKEARVTGTQLPIVYDFLYNYLQTHQVYSVAAGADVNFGEPEAQFVFRTFYQIARDHGNDNTNWASLESTSMNNNLLALNKDAERAAAIRVALVTGKAGRQASLKLDAEKYRQAGDIWPESLQYSGEVGENSVKLMILHERYDPSLRLFDEYPNVAISLSRKAYMQYPNREQISFGDGHRYTGGQPFRSYEMAYAHAKERGYTRYTSHYGALINGGIAAGDHEREDLDGYSSLGRHDEVLHLLWSSPTVDEPSADLDLPRTDRLPFAGVALQRNLSAAGSRYGLMGFVGGGAFIHSHASGMSMELYGMGEVLGAKSGRETYGSDIHENYYRVWASNNTVVVNGASRGQGAWQDLGMNTVQVAAMEPQPFTAGVSPDVSFTCSTFLDDKGTLAEATQQRTLSLIRTSDTTGYYVDIYRSRSVLPGEFHDYIYRNLADSVSLEDDAGPLSLVPQPARFQTDIGDGYKQPGWRYFTDTMVSPATSAPVRARFLANNLKAGPTSMSLHMPGQVDREYARVSSPPILEAASPYHTRRAPTLIVRQTGEAWNRPFAVVFEPHLGNSGSVQNVTKLEQAGVVVGLKVECTVGGQSFVQYVLSNPTASDTYTNAELDLTFRGRFAVITDKGPGARTLYIGEGAALSYRGLNVASTSGDNTQANVVFSGGSAPVVTANSPVNVSATLTFADWTASYGLVNAAASHEADPDGDGFKNLLEYYSGLNPSVPEASGGPAATLEEGNLVFRYTRAKLIAGASADVFTSTDLVNWSPVGSSLESSSATHDDFVATVSVGSATKLFARLVVTADDTSVTSASLGLMNVTVAGGSANAPATTVLGIPMDDTSIPPAGIRAGLIESFTANTLTNSFGGWTSPLHLASAPWALRITSGMAAGKLLDVVATASDTLTVSGADLTELGLTAGVDSFELVPMDTLGSLFPAGTLLGGTTPSSADNVLVRSGTAWLPFFYDTSRGFWRRTIGPISNSNHVLIRPATGVQIIHRGPATQLSFTGRVLATSFRATIYNASTTVIHAGFPEDDTLGSLALQTLLPGWRTGTNPGNVDSLSLHNGSLWVAYVHDGSHWQPAAGPASNSDDVVVPAGALLSIQRPGATSGTTDLVRVPLPSTQ